jgi:OOP family OmpA-OmpF porin
VLRLAVVLLLSALLPVRAEQAATGIPLVAGLRVTTAVAEADGDYESRKQLLRREGEGWQMGYDASLPSVDGKPVSMRSERLLRDADLGVARIYRNRFESDTEEDYPGTTALGASTAVLAELEAGGKARFALVGEEGWLARAGAGAGAAVDFAAALLANPNVVFKGALQRQSAGHLRVLVNGVAQALPVLIASGRFTAKSGQTIDAELSLLRDPANPLALQWRIGTSSLRVVRIDFPAAQPVLAQALKAQRRVVLPGLLFDFGSAQLRPESSAALPAIVDAIRSVPGGALRLEGHTDSIGDAARNQRLSQARADAVRAALVAIDGTLAARLTEVGWGATKPVAGNDTLEGRAQNRRVELVLP